MLVLARLEVFNSILYITKENSKLKIYIDDDVGITENEKARTPPNLYFVKYEFPLPNSSFTNNKLRDNFHYKCF